MTCPVGVEVHIFSLSINIHPYVCTHAMEALVRLYICADSPEHSLVQKVPKSRALVHFFVFKMMLCFHEITSLTLNTSENPVFGHASNPICLSRNPENKNLAVRVSIHVCFPTMYNGCADQIALSQKTNMENIKRLSHVVFR